jgi:hypothetical protein
MRARLALLVVVVLLVLGCGSRPSSTPIAPSNGWVASILGAPSNMSIVLRPQALLADPYWGPAMQRAVAKPSKHEDADEVPNAQLAPFLSSSQMEVYLAVRDQARLSNAPKESLGAETLGYVYIVRGAPRLDPLSLTTNRRERLWAAPARLPSGVLEFPPSREYAQRKRGLAASLYVMPDGTWVGVDQGTSQRARAIYTQSAFAPPPASFDGEGLFGGFVDRAVLDAVTSRAETKNGVWRQNLGAAGLVLYGGRDGALEALLDYGDSDDASRTQDWIESELKAACQNNELLCLLVKAAIRDVKVSRDGKRVGVRFFLTEALLRKISEG